MRRIRFKPELIEKIRQGKKNMTFRLTERKVGYYIVEEGGHPYYKHIDSGVRIQITFSCFVSNVHEYIEQYYQEEGFDSPKELELYLMDIHKKKLPRTGYAHVFRVAQENEVGLMVNS